MSDKFPIINPPVQNPDAAILHRETDQKNIGYFQRKVIANLLSNLNNTLQDAAVHIGDAPQLYDAPGQYALMHFSRITEEGRGGGPAWTPEDLQNFIIKRKALYTAWRKDCPPMPISVCERVCQQEISLRQIAFEERFRRSEALALLQYGLNRYAIVAGWGDQIGG